jgi:hypothetical protein
VNDTRIKCIFGGETSLIYRYSLLQLLVTVILTFALSTVPNAPNRSYSDTLIFYAQFGSLPNHQTMTLTPTPTPLLSKRIPYARVWTQEKIRSKHQPIVRPSDSGCKMKGAMGEGELRSRVYLIDLHRVWQGYDATQMSFERLEAF